MRIFFLLLILGFLSCIPSRSMDAISGSFAVPTSGTQDVGSLGFDPNVVLFRWTSSTADGTAVDTSIGWGAFTATESMALYARQTDGSLNADGHQDTGSCIVLIDSNGNATEKFTCAFGTTGQNKFTLTTVTGGAAVKVFYTALRVTAAKIIPFQTSTTTADQAITGAGFSPDAVFFFTAGIQDTDITALSATYTHMGIGFASSASNEGGAGASILSASNADTRSLSTSKMIYVPSTSAMWLEGDVKSIDSDGITIQWTTVQGTAVAGWLLFLDGVQFSVGSFAQTSGTGDTVVGSLPFTQEAAGFTSACMASASGQQSDGVIANGGATSSSLEGGITSASTSGNNVADHAFDSDEAFICYTAGTPTLNAKGNVSAWSAGSFTVTWTTADSTLRQWLYWIMGDAAAAATTRRKAIIIN